mmetsp:Transcript_21551/g.85699  ORF Transcript_21551/g.85699 Transcript_21551/m.85699 type:complete len:230 (-) Transcript_21551:178-867(-)
MGRERIRAVSVDPRTAEVLGTCVVEVTDLDAVAVGVVEEELDDGRARDGVLREGDAAGVEAGLGGGNVVDGEGEVVCAADEGLVEGRAVVLRSRRAFAEVVALDEVELEASGEVEPGAVEVEGRPLDGVEAEDVAVEGDHDGEPARLATDVVQRAQAQERSPAMLDEVEVVVVVVDGLLGRSAVRVDVAPDGVEDRRGGERAALERRATPAEDAVDEVARRGRRCRGTF